MTSAVQAAPKRGLISRLLSYENALVFILALTWGFVFFDRQAINALSPFIVKALSLSNTQLGVLSSGLSGTWALSAYLIGPVYKDVVVYSLFVLVLWTRPQGLMGKA